MYNLVNLPDEILLSIAYFLPAHDIANFSTLAKRFHLFYQREPLLKHIHKSHLQNFSEIRTQICTLYELFSDPLSKDKYSKLESLKDADFSSIAIPKQINLCMYALYDFVRINHNIIGRVDRCTEIKFTLLRLWKTFIMDTGKLSLDFERLDREDIEELITTTLNHVHHLELRGVSDLRRLEEPKDIILQNILHNFTGNTLKLTLWNTIHGVSKIAAGIAKSPIKHIILDMDIRDQSELETFKIVKKAIEKNTNIISIKFDDSLYSEHQFYCIRGDFRKLQEEYSKLEQELINTIHMRANPVVDGISKPLLRGFGMRSCFS